MKIETIIAALKWICIGCIMLIGMGFITIDFADLKGDDMNRPLIIIATAFVLLVVAGISYLILSD